jgi:hypothetical protein
VFETKERKEVKRKNNERQSAISVFLSGQVPFRLWHFSKWKFMGLLTDGATPPKLVGPSPWTTVPIE